MKVLLASVLAALALAVLPAMAVVNINTGTVTELESLHGIGAKKAKAIVDYRTKNGAFKSVDELEKVSGIGKATVEKLRKDITVGGAATPPSAKPVSAAAPTSKTGPAPKKP
ncbi:ComEA family DNA-binding protein [Chitinimonas sp. BJB300]|uniref:ComEA family DNA-binding protein n=1 Tax=Chitinimonas sp. BJB300 TaxID=1559339 RepID=UPI000C0CB926|nr:helix-hairpin-helix domain-containing protein [Chitinimonas sp. BJB300]PHV12578.1 topoisomerase [Chitinimonas sp. BJB300]TSJ90029.1 helix-hairpin-helix domain-containing protein [Chitinimonas sp. BJB300]